MPLGLFLTDCILCIWVCTLCVQCPQRPEEGVGSFASVSTDVVSCSVGVEDGTWVTWKNMA